MLALLVSPQYFCPKRSLGMPLWSLSCVRSVQRQRSPALKLALQRGQTIGTGKGCGGATIIREVYGDKQRLWTMQAVDH